MSSGEEMFEFSVTSADGVKLATADKVCKKNIKVTPVLQEKTQLGSGVVTPDEGYVGLNKVTFTAALQEKNQNGAGIVTPDEGYDGLSKVTFTAALQEKTQLGAGVVTPDEGYDGLSKVTFTPNLQEKTITANGTVTPDSGYEGFSQVIIDIPTIKLKSVTTTVTAVNNKYQIAHNCGVIPLAVLITSDIKDSNLGTYVWSGCCANLDRDSSPVIDMWCHNAYYGLVSKLTSSDIIFNHDLGFNPDAQYTFYFFY